MGAPDLLANLAALGVTVAAQGGNLLVQPWSLVPDELRLKLRQSKPELLQVLTPAPARPYKLTPADADAAHADPWDDTVVARFEARTTHIQRLGFGEKDAHDLAERLHLRDMHADYRHQCIECGQLRRWRCADHRTARLATPEISRDLATMFQVCAGFCARPH